MLERLALRVPPRFVPPRFAQQVLWVFGSPRSGSTWLLRMLGDHPRVVAINEPQIGWYLGPFMCDLPAVDPDKLGIDTFTLRRIQQDRRQQFFAEEFSDVWLPALTRMLRERFYAHAVRYPPAAGLTSILRGKGFVLVKEPNGSQSADLLARAMPESRFLFLLRDGRDVVDSELAANLAGSWVAREFPGAVGLQPDDRLSFVVQSAKKWLWRTEVVETAFAEHRGPKLLLRYEDLLEDPLRHLREVLEWLGDDLPGDDLRRIVATHSFAAVPAEARGPSRFHRSASVGTWRQNLHPDEQDALEAVLGDKLRDLSYA